MSKLMEDLKSLEREGIRKYDPNDPFLHGKDGQEKRWYSRRMLEILIEQLKAGEIDNKDMINYLRKHAKNRDDISEWEKAAEGLRGE